MSRGRFRDIAEEDRENRKLLGVVRSRDGRIGSCWEFRAAGTGESEVVGSFAQPGRENRKLLGVLRTSRSVLLTREAVLALETPIYFPMALETPIYFPIVIETPIYFRKMPSGQKASLVFEACGG